MRRVKVPVVLVALLSLLPALPLLAAGGSRAPSPSPSASIPSTPAKSPEELAVEEYNSALDHRDKAWKIEAEIDKASTREEADRLGMKAEKQYAKALKLLEKAVEHNPKMHQAWSSLGYTRRKVGIYDSALEAYDRALELVPTYAEAIEYRAEAYLALGRLDDAKAAFATLDGRDQERAGKLLEAMRAWVEAHRKDAQGMSPADVETFAGWVDQQGSAQTARASRSGW